MPETPARARIEPRDEGHHEDAGEPGWRERLSFAFFDSVSGFAGIARVDVVPGSGADGSLTIFVPGGGVATVLAKGATYGAGWSVARLALEVEEPLKRWRLSCKDVALLVSEGGKGRRGAAVHLTADLAFDAWMRPAGGLERETLVEEGFVRVVSSGHFEQAGGMAGTLSLGSNEVSLHGGAVRDKSWGPRNDTATHASRWFALPFGRDLSIGARAVTIGERTMRSGWVLRDGVVRALRSLRAREEYEGRRVASLTLEVVDDAGECYEVEGETVAVMQTREQRSPATHALTRWRLGPREALGLAEYVGS